MKRRDFLSGIGAGATALSLAPGISLLAGTQAARAEGNLTFVSWGGSTQDAQVSAWAEPFAAESGVTVVQDGPTDYGKLRAMVESGNVTWDVVDVQGTTAYQLAAEGMLEPIDYSIVPKETLDPRFSFEYGVGSFFSSYVLGYNKSSLGDRKPQGWSDLFDTQAFPGKRTFYKWVNTAAFEIPLLADGVPADKLYPLDIDRAFAKLDTIKKDIVWWNSGAQSQQLLASGEAAMGMFWNGRLYTMMKEGADMVDMVWAQATPGVDMLVVPKGAKNKEAAMRFLAYASAPKPQAEFANLTAYSPINTAAIEHLDQAMLPHMPFEHQSSQISPDFNYWARELPEISKRWYAWQTA